MNKFIHLRLKLNKTADVIFSNLAPNTLTLQEYDRRAGHPPSLRPLPPGRRKRAAKAGTVLRLLASTGPLR